MKKVCASLITALLLAGMSVSVAAVPYQNYTVTESGAHVEPQAYVSDRVINTASLGIDQLGGIAMSKPSDLAQFKLNGWVLVSDTENNRIVVLDETMTTVKQLITSWAPAGYVKPEETEEPVKQEEAPQETAQEAPAGTDGSTETPGETANPDTGEKEEEITTPASEYGFSSPDGLFLYENELTDEYYLYVCDPGNQRIERFLFDTEKEQFSFEKQFDQVKMTNENDRFVPKKVVVDAAKRMFVVVKDINQGLVELSEEGTFTKYYGATRTKANLSSLFSRFFSAEAKSLSVQNLSTEYSNITMDSQGFIYGTIATLTATDLNGHFKDSTEIGAALRKLNAAGSDVMKRQGIEPPSGINGNGVDRSSYSYMVDTTVSVNGLVSALDDYQGRVFTYTSYGELLYVFGGRGQRTAAQEAEETTTQSGYSEGTALAPVAIQLLQDDQTYAILDKDGAAITTYVPTEYGTLLREAVNAHEERRYTDAKAAWNEILAMSSNSTLAYSGIGKVLYLEASQELDMEVQKQTFLEAAEYFKKAYDQDNYAEAFYQYRDLVLTEVMPYLMSGIIVVVVLCVGFACYRKFRKFVRTGGKADE